MRKLGWMILLAILVTVIPISANSGPVYWEGYPSSNVLVIEENSPIRVEEENLIFDFSQNEEGYHTLSGRVTATYKMLNPTTEKYLAQMAFPFIGKVNSFLPEEIVLTADGNPLPYEIYLGEVVRDREQFDFANIVQTISSESYQGVNFTNKQKAKLYTITVKPTTEQRINFAIDFDFNHEETKILTAGFNRYERNGEKTRLAAWCYEEEQLEILVLGEDIELRISSYTDGELKEKTDLVTYEIFTEEIEVEQYLLNFIEKRDSGESKKVLPQGQLFNMYANSLDRYLTQNIGLCTAEDLTSEEYIDRIFTLVYQVDFPANGEKEVSIGYKTLGTMDKRETGKPQYSFDYLLNPAGNWAQFNNLNIEIIPPVEAPFLIKSTVEFTLREDGIYTAQLADLPEEDLSFTLYEDEEITPLDKASGAFQRNFGYFTPLIIGAIVLIILSGIVIIAIKYYQRRRGGF